MAENREVHGIRCFDVLGHLSDYLDGEVDVELKARIEGHLLGCDACERFGTEVGAAVRALRQRLASEKTPEATRSRLRERLERERIKSNV